MINKLRKTCICAASVATLLLAPVAISHFDDKEMAQSYRQSWFAIVASNFGPMAAMMKGDMPYDESRMKEHASDLSALASMNIMRGFAEGTDQGTTRAKPEVWENKEDFSKKMDDLVTAIAALDAAAQTGEKKEIAPAFGATGKACKACHDDYKSKDYLY
ncbi:MAG: cytochrome c [Pseudomonadota bacterium]